MNNDPILEIRSLRKLFPAGRQRLWGEPDRFVHAVDDVSLTLGRSEVLAVVGESGSGKSTLALTLMGLEKSTAGQIIFNGQDITALSGRALKDVRRQMQMIFQDPYESLNPLMTIGEAVAEPLRVHKLGRSGGRSGGHDSGEKMARVRQALEDAGLKPADDYLHRRPHELSGGQRQRVVIACALVLEPIVLLADEPVSMLDVSIRAEILTLLSDLRQTRGISVLFITHDLGTAAYLADRLAVMYLGRVVEVGPTAGVLHSPQHPYTKALLSVAPVPNPRLRHEKIILQGETPNPIDLPPGCRFHPRCPVAFDRCRETDPPHIQIGHGHSAACLLLSAEQGGQ